MYSITYISCFGTITHSLSMYTLIIPYICTTLQTDDLQNCTKQYIIPFMLILQKCLKSKQKN